MALLIRNRLAVRIAGSHPADRGSIPRYGSNVMVSDTVGPRDSYATNLFCLAPIAAHLMFWLLPLPPDSGNLVRPSAVMEWSPTLSAQEIPMKQFCFAWRPSAPIACNKLASTHRVV